MLLHSNKRLLCQHEITLPHELQQCDVYDIKGLKLQKSKATHIIIEQKDL